MMTLHEAIEELLMLTRKAMTANEIADCLNKNKLYVKGDKSLIRPNQINARVNNYPGLFEIDRSTSPLKIKLFNKPFPLVNQLIENKDLISIQLNKFRKNEVAEIELIEKILLSEKNFKRAAEIDNLVSTNPGLYCIRVSDINQLPSPFNTILAEREHNIVYIGIASESLNKRFLNQELRAKGHGTFFRSLGAVLGHRPPKGSLQNKKNKRNYKFSVTDELNIIKWINECLIVNWVDFNGDFETLETKLIVKHRPLFNLAKNPSALVKLSELRKECVEIANGI